MRRYDPLCFAWRRAELRISIEWNHLSGGKGALSRAVPANPRRLVGTLRFAHTMTLPYDRNVH